MENIDEWSRLSPMQETAETVNDILAEHLGEKGVTELCAKAGIAPYTLRRMRRGIGSRQHAATIAAVARALGVNARRLRDAIERTRRAREE